MDGTEEGKGDRCVRELVGGKEDKPSSWGE